MHIFIFNKINGTFLERKFTQSLNRVQNVPNRLDSVDVVAVYYGYIQRDDLLAVRIELLQADANDVDYSQNLCTMVVPP